MTHNTLPIFISYASYDNSDENQEERWLDRLLQHLKPLDLEGLVATWNDTELTVGNDWRHEIRQAIEKAKVAILLVSPAFLASEFIRTEELPRLLQKANSNSAPTYDADGMAEGMLILPILLRPCLIEKVKFEILADTSEASYSYLSDFQYIPKRKAMNGLSQYEQDIQFKAIAERIYEALEITQQGIEVQPEENELPKLEQLLNNFLCEYSNYWFNALRISNWGSQQDNYKKLKDYSLSEIKYTLTKLEKDNIIKAKDGKKSRVYKCM